jgi:hypothetical protein
MDNDADKQEGHFAPVPLWLWRATVGTLAFVIAIGLAAALWLGTRPEVSGSSISVGNLGAWTLGPGAVGSEAGGQFTLRANAEQTDPMAYATGELMLADFAVEVRVAPLNGPDDAAYGLVLRHSGPDEFVALLIGADGYIAVGQMSSGKWRWRVPWQQWPHIQRGQAENILRAECRADRCRFYVNGEFAFEVDGVPAEGRIGPAVWNPEAASGSATTFWGWHVWK